MNAILYARFSPRPNGDLSESIAMQLERCRAYCLSMGWTVIGEHEDRELSGARVDNRPGLQQAEAQARKAKGVLVVYSLSRLARNTRDAIEIADRLEKAGANLTSLTERIDTTSPAGRLFFTLIAAFAQFERETIAQRTSDAMRRKQANGQRMSRIAPFGWRIEGESLVEDPREQEIAGAIAGLRRQGHGFREIARQMTAMGILCRGGPWNHSTIRAIIDRS